MNSVSKILLFCEWPKWNKTLIDIFKYEEGFLKHEIGCKEQLHRAAKRVLESRDSNLVEPE